MTMHLDDLTLQHLAHDEPIADAAVVAAHLKQCAECRARLDALRADDARVNTLLGALDESMPATEPRWAAPAAAQTPPTAGWQRAAAIAALLGAGALAYALPGSPLRTWLRGGETAEVVQTPAPGAPTPVAPDAAGIAVAVEDGVTVEFVRALPDNAVQVTRGDVELLTVRGDDPAASFSYEQNRIIVANYADGARFQIVVPQGARAIVVRIGERVVYRSDQP